MLRTFRVIRNTALVFSLCFCGVVSAHTYTAAAKPNQSALVKANEVVGRARQLLGTPYHFGGTSVRGGFDCSGLIVYLFGSEAHMHLPRTTQQILRTRSAPRVSRTKLKPGDVVFFNHNGGGRVSHMGLYIGNKRFIHAPRTGKSVMISSLTNPYWRAHYIGAKRFLTASRA